MKKAKIISGCLGVCIGYILLLLLIDVLSKPDNVPMSLKPIESMQTYFFGFVFSMGTLGWVLGSLLLLGYLAMFNYLGIWIIKMLFKN